MKKTIKLFFLITMVICIIGVSTDVKAADSNIFSITNATGTKDEEVTVYISLEQQLEFASADLIIEYDPSKLEYIKYTELEIFKKSAMNIVKNNTDTGKIAIGYVSNPTASDLTKQPGQMLSITFKIKSNSEETIKLNLKCTSLKNDAGDSINVSDKQSEIKIKSQTSNNTNNNSNNNSSSNSNSNENSISVKAKETKNKVKSSLPYTGTSIGVISCMIIIFAIISYYFYKKYIYLRKI